MESISLTDERVIGEQLGRHPRGLLNVAHRCQYGYPQVIIVRPVVDKTPFPTTFWLTCPFLRKGIEHLEAEGWVGKLDRSLDEDKDFRRRFQAAQRAYIAERARLLDDEDRRYLEQTGMLRSLLERGIGGTADLNKVKCLHLHVAHALVRQNPVGAFVLQRLQEHACPPQNVICSAF